MPDPDITQILRMGRDALQNILQSWEIFHANLPDGEYKGLGEMRIAITSAKNGLHPSGKPVDLLRIQNPLEKAETEKVAAHPTSESGTDIKIALAKELSIICLQSFSVQVGESDLAVRIRDLAYTILGTKGHEAKEETLSQLNDRLRKIKARNLAKEAVPKAESGRVEEQ